MSIRLIARDLYRAQQNVGRLEAELAKAPVAEKDEIERELQLARIELRQMRNILEGEKAPPPYKSRPATLKKRW